MARPRQGAQRRARYDARKDTSRGDEAARFGRLTGLTMVMSLSLNSCPIACLKVRLLIEK